MKLRRWQVIDIFMEGFSLLDQIHVVNRFFHQRIAALAADPENKSSVVHGGIIHDRVMHYPRRDYHQVSRGHFMPGDIVFSMKDFHSDIAFDEEVALIVVVGVGIQCVEVTVGVVKDLEVGGDHILS
jgi:hypothetical protein